MAKKKLESKAVELKRLHNIAMRALHNYKNVKGNKSWEQAKKDIKSIPQSSAENKRRTTSKQIMKKAWEIKKKTNVDLSSALKQAYKKPESGKNVKKTGKTTKKTGKTGKTGKKGLPPVLKMLQERAKEIKKETGLPYSAAMYSAREELKSEGIIKK